MLITMTNNQWLYMVIPVTTIDITINPSNANQPVRLAFEGLGEAFGHWAIRSIRWDLIHHGWAAHHVAAALDVFLEEPGHHQLENACV